MIKQVQIRQLMLLQVQSGVIGPGSCRIQLKIVSSTYLQALRSDKTQQQVLAPAVPWAGRMWIRDRVWWLTGWHVMLG